MICVEVYEIKAKLTYNDHLITGQTLSVKTFYRLKSLHSWTAYQRMTSLAMMNCKFQLTTLYSITSIKRSPSGRCKVEC